MATYSAKKKYDVKLTRAVKHGAFTYKPLNEIEMTGALLTAIIGEHGEGVVDYAKPA